MSSLRNRPVICGNKQVGFLQSVMLDTAQKRVHVLCVSRGLKGKCVVYPQQVLSMTDDFILVNAVSQYKRTLETSACRFLMDTAGQLVGRIVDYAMHPERMDILAVEVIPGYLPSERHSRIWVYDYLRSNSASCVLTGTISCDHGPIMTGEGV